MDNCEYSYCKLPIFGADFYYCRKAKKEISKKMYYKYCYKNGDFGKNRYLPMFSTESKSCPYSGSNSYCYLTSACVEYMGKEDNCYELTVLRNFRDTYLSNSDTGMKLIEEYYQTAPILVERINESNKKDELYKMIYMNINKCIAQIKENNYEKAKLIYIKMVNNLRELTEKP